MIRAIFRAPGTAGRVLIFCLHVASPLNKRGRDWIQSHAIGHVIWCRRLVRHLQGCNRRYVAPTTFTVSTPTQSAASAGKAL